jgi:hypothetical protein
MVDWSQSQYNYQPIYHYHFQHYYSRTNFHQEKGSGQAAIVWALYCLKSSDSTFGDHLDGCMHKMGYHSYPPDADLSLKEQKNQKGNKNY